MDVLTNSTKDTLEAGIHRPETKSSLSCKFIALPPIQLMPTKATSKKFHIVVLPSYSRPDGQLNHIGSSVQMSMLFDPSSIHHPIGHICQLS